MNEKKEWKWMNNYVSILKYSIVNIQYSLSSNKTIHDSLILFIILLTTKPSYNNITNIKTALKDKYSNTNKKKKQPNSTLIIMNR